MRFIHQLLIVLLLSSVTSSIYAQTDTKVLNDLNVSATRIESDKFETGRDITILDVKQIQASGAASVADLLRFVQGVEVMPRGPFGVQADLSMRASTFSQTILLIDGMKLGDPLTGHFNSNIPIPMNQIDHIEVLRGAAAAQYGADAVGGVINIITKTRAQKLTKQETNLAITAGDYNLYAGKLNTFQCTKKSSFDLGIEGMYSKGPKPQGVNNSFDIITTSGAFAVKIGQSSLLSYRIAFDSRDFKAKYFYTKSSADKAAEITQNVWNQVGFNHKGKKTSTQLDFVWRYNYDNYLFNAASVANIHYTNLYNFQAYQNLILNKSWQFNYGVQGDFKTIKSNDRGNHSNIHAGVFVGMIIHPTKAFVINFNHRLDYDQNYKLAYIPYLSLAYNTKLLTLRVNGGKSIRAADFTERYISSNLVGPLSAGRNLGNANLQAEKFWNVEGGFDIKVAKAFVWSVTGFSRWGNNQIDYVVTNSDELTNFTNLLPNKNYFFAKNIKAVNTSGFETGVNFKKEIGKKSSIYANAGYIYAFSKMNSGQITKYISNHARHLFTFNATAKIYCVDLGISALYKYKLPDTVPSTIITSNEYFLMNFRVGVRLLKDKLGIHANIDNISNTKYTEILGAQQPGRWAYFTLSYNF